MRRYFLPLVLGSYLACGSASDLPPDAKLTRGGFPDVTKLDLFKRSVTTEAEVIRQLGTPSGRGGALFAPDYQKRVVLFYESVKVSNSAFTSTTPGGPMYMQVEWVQEILGVLILDGHFDGFLWTTNIAHPEYKFDPDIPIKQ
jgi:hypothetical protein